MNVGVPVKVGEPANTRAPEPVLSVTMPSTFALVSSEVVAILELKVFQSVFERQPVTEAVAMMQEMVLTDRESGAVKERTDSFALKVDQSVFERSPSTVLAPAVGILSVCVNPDEAQPQPPAFEVVAKF